MKELKKRMTLALSLMVCLLLFSSMVSAKPIEKQAQAIETMKPQANLIQEKKSMDLPEEVQMKIKEISSQAITEKQKELEKDFPSFPQGLFVFWTNNGQYIGWGVYGNHFFKGEDNYNHKFFGLYFRGKTIGLYDGKFFIGRYHKGHFTMKFNEKIIKGQYVKFPFP